MHLVARRLAERTAPRAENELHGVAPRVCGSSPPAGGYPAAIQNFLENSPAPFHTLVMGSGGAAQPARNRPPTVDCKSRTALHIRATVLRRRSAQAALQCPDTRPAWAGSLGPGAPTISATADPLQHTMIGNLPIVNAHDTRFGENIHTKFRKSAAIAPILHNNASEHYARHSGSQHDGLWGNQTTSGATPNEWSGR